MVDTRRVDFVILSAVAMSVDLDVDLFIAEIQKRPALYDKSLQEYAEKNIKDKLWAEVCEVMLENWKTMTPQEKREKSKLTVFCLFRTSNHNRFKCEFCSFLW